MNVALSPKAQGFRQPAEWEKQDAVWLAFPSHGELWLENLLSAQKEFIAFCEALGPGEQLNVLVPDIEAGKTAENALKHLRARIYLVPFGDIWLRDTAPVFLTSGTEVAAACFGFNSWGGKYNLPYDTEVSARVADESGLRRFTLPLILEGGSVESDGEGTCLTSRQCLLNPNRNPGMSQAQIETALLEGLGADKILWLGDGLLNDHTDGHIDTIARFVGPGQVLCMRAGGEDDPNREILAKIEADLNAMTDAKGRALSVGVIPSPGEVLNEDGDVMPASYLNFYIGNQAVVVPTYGTKYDDEAVRAIAAYFPKHRTLGCSAKSILTGGGAFHCISQHQPSLI